MNDSQGQAEIPAGFGQSRSLAGPDFLARAGTAFRVGFGILTFILVL
jgi:hypothetical protein